MQDKIFQHINDNPGLGEKIIALHQQFNDDIVFENSTYFKLRALIT